MSPSPGTCRCRDRATFERETGTFEGLRGGGGGSSREQAKRKARKVVGGLPPGSEARSRAGAALGPKTSQAVHQQQNWLTRSRKNSAIVVAT